MIEDKPELIPVTEVRRQKMNLFTEEVVKPLAEVLSKFDSESLIMVGGSFQKKPDKLRQGSDLDLIIISEKLKDPHLYINFLLELQKKGDEFREKNGIVPVWFTQVAREEALRFISYQHVKYDLPPAQYGLPAEERMLPIHLLFYPNKKSLYTREQTVLANSLITGSTAIKGNRPNDQELDKLAKDINSLSTLDLAKWNLERAMAELILNENSLPYAYRVAEYKGLVWQTIRNQFQSALTKQNRGDVMNILQEIQSNIINEMMPLEDIHRNGSEILYPLDKLLQPTLSLISIVNEKEQERHSFKRRKSR